MSIVRFKVQYPAEVSTGLSTGGHLDLQGRLREVCCLEISHRHGNDTFPAHYLADELYLRPSVDVDFNGQTIGYVGPLGIVYLDRQGLDKLVASNTYRIFAISAVLDNSNNIVGILFGFDDAGERSFCRIEYFRTDVRQKLLARQPDEATFPCLSYDQDEGLHTFRMF